MKIKKKLCDKKFLLEEYNLRNGSIFKKFYFPKERKILEKNDYFLKKIEDNEYKFKKILLEKNIDKCNEDYYA